MDESAGFEVFITCAQQLPYGKQSTNSNKRSAERDRLYRERHRERQQKYYEKNKEKINKRKRDHRSERNISQSLPATTAERNRIYRERNKQKINQRRKNSRLLQRNLRLHTECNINNLDGIEHFAETTLNNPQNLNSSNDNITQDIPQNSTSSLHQHNTQHFEEMVIKLIQIDSDDPAKITLSLGEHLFGRGKLLGCDDKRISRNHGELHVFEDRIKIKALHQNPCFYTKKGTEDKEILRKDSVIILSNGDRFGLLPDAFWYEVVVTVQNGSQESEIDDTNTEEYIEKTLNPDETVNEESPSITPETSETVLDTHNRNDNETETNKVTVKRTCSTEQDNGMEIKKVKTEPVDHTEVDIGPTEVQPAPTRVQIDSTGVKTEPVELKTEHVELKTEPVELKIEPTHDTSTENNNTEPVDVKQESNDTAGPSVNQAANNDGGAAHCNANRPPRERCLYGANCYSAIEIEVAVDVYQERTQQQSQQNLQSTKRPYSNAERQKRYRERRKADKMNACTSSQSSDDQPQQEQVHDVQINKPQTSAERQRKYRRLLRERRLQQADDINAKRKNIDAAELARQRYLNKQRQSRYRARQRLESPSTSSDQAQAERRNLAHVAQFSHPTDTDWGTEARAPCPFGAGCGRRDPRHFRDHTHPPGHRPPPPGMQVVEKHGNVFYINATAQVNFYDDHFEVVDSDGEKVDHDYEL